MAGALLTRGLAFAPFHLVLDGLTSSSVVPLVIPELYSVIVPEASAWADVDPDLTTLLN